MVIDCTQSIESKAQRRIAIDFSKFLITNKKQVSTLILIYCLLYQTFLNFFVNL